MTARLADSYNREVYALPGRVDDLRSQGCNLLIRNRTATPLTSVEDFMKEFGISAGKRHQRESDDERLERLYKGNLTEDRIALMSRLLLAIRNQRGISLEELAEKSGMEYHKVTQLTGMLETDGVITVDLLQRCFINFR